MARTSSSPSYHKVPRAPSPAEFEAGCYAILNVLSCSPLFLWIDINEVSIFLKDQLPHHIQNGVLELEPFWNFLKKVQGVQEDALVIFFQELTRHDFPWSLRLPRALQTNDDAPIQDGSSAQLDAVLSFDEDDDLEIEWEELPPNPSGSAQAVPVESDSTEELEEFYFEELEVRFDEDEEFENQELTALSHDQLPAQVDKNAQGLEIILGLLSASPLALWVNLDSFQQYMERRLPEYITDDILDLEPIWSNLHAIPGAQGAALEGFFEELVRQAMPWKLCLPKKFEDNPAFQTNAVVSRATLQDKKLLLAQAAAHVNAEAKTHAQVSARIQQRRNTPSPSTTPVKQHDHPLPHEDDDDFDLNFDEIDTLSLDEDLDFAPPTFHAKQPAVPSHLPHRSPASAESQPPLTRKWFFESRLITGMLALIVLLIVSILGVLLFYHPKHNAKAPVSAHHKQHPPKQMFGDFLKLIPRDAGTIPDAHTPTHSTTDGADNADEDTRILDAGDNTSDENANDTDENP